MQDNIPDNVINHIKNVQLMVEKCRAFGVRRVLLRISLSIFEDIHNRLVHLSRNLNICYIDNRNIYGLDLFKEGLRLLECGKKLLANNVIFYLNKLLLHAYKRIVPI